MSVAMENRWKRKLQDESNAANDLRRNIEAAHMQRKERMKAVPPTPNPNRREVARWMKMHANEYECATSLAEGANVEFDFPIEWMDDETHWVWDEAARWSDDK